MELFKILGTIAIDNQNANKGIDETTEKAEDSHSKISSAFSKIGAAAEVAGKAIAAGLAAGVTAMAGLTVKALNAAGELEQNMGGSEAVFGEYAKKMQDTASQAFSNMGLSASDFLATANKMGALFQGAGFGIEESAELSAQAMQRAADVASIMGLDTSAAMEAIAGAAKGNFTMMDNLGVAMNETSLEAYALANGFEKAYSEMSQQEKIGVAMEMFLDKTSYATGNYAKENKTLAGSLGTAKAALQNFLSGAGDVDSLVGALVNAGEVIAENLQTLLPNLIEGLNSLISQLLPYLPALLEELLPGIIEGGFILLEGLAMALIQAFPILLDAVKMLFGQIWDYIAVELLGTEANFETSFTKIQEFFQGLWEVLQGVWETIGQPIWDMISNCVDSVRGVFETMMPEIQEFVSQCFGDIQVLWENNLKPCLDAIGNFIQNVLAPIFNAVFNTTIKGYIDTAFNGIKNLWNNTLKPVFTGITDFLTGVFTLDWEKAWNGIVETFKGIINIIPTVVESVINGAIDVINGLIGGVNAIAEKIGIGQISLIGKVSIPKLEEGGILEKGQIGFLEGNGAEAVVPLDQNKAWISAVAKDMNTALGGADNERLQRIIELLQELIETLPESLAEALLALKFDINNREFARLVKAVN